MAFNTSPPNKKPPSFLGVAAAAAPLGFASFHVTKRIKQHATSIIPKEQAQVAAFRHAAKAIASIQVPSIDQHLDLIGKLQGSKFYHSSAGGELVRMAWQQAAQFAQARAKQPISEITQHISNLPTEQVTEALSQLMKTRHTSTYNATLKKFSKNLTTLEKHYDIMKSLPKLAPAVYKAAAPQSINTPTGLPDWMRGHLSRWEEKGVQFVRASKYTRPGISQSAYMMHFQAPQGQRFSMLLPEVSGGIAREGVSLRTSYIAPGAGIYDPVTKSLSTLTRPQYMMEEFERGILPSILGGQLKGRDINQAIKAMRSETLHKMQTVSPSGPSGYTPAESRYIQSREARLQLLVPNEVPKGIHSNIYRWRSAFRAPTEEEYSAAMAAHKLKGGISPTNIMEGFAATSDISQTYMTPQAADFSRRLEQFNRPYSLSPAAQELGQKYYGKHSVLDSPEMKAMYKNEALPPNLRVLYVDPAKYGAQLKNLGIGEGEFMLRRSRAKLFEAERYSHLTLRNIDTDALAAIQGGTADTLAEGRILGWNVKTGRAVTAANIAKKKIMDIQTYQSEGQGEYYTLRLMHTEKMRQHAKFFRDLKGMALFEKDHKFNQALKEFGVLKQGYDAIAYMDDARKNASLHNKQMISALREVIDKNFRRAGTTPIPGSTLYDIWSNPVGFARNVADIASEGGKYSHQNFVKQLMRTAVHQADVTPGEFGHIFGIAPLALGETTAVSLAEEVFKSVGRPSQRAIRAMSRGFASGRGQIFYGGPRIDAGGLGSIEPRFLDILSGSHFGAAGTAFKNELIESMIQTDPNKYSTHSSLVKSIQSMIGMEPEGILSNRPAFSAQSYTKAGFQKWIEEGGGYLNLGKGMSNVFVPGATAFGGMAPYTTAGDKTIRGTIPDIYHRIASSASQMYSETDPLGKREMQRVLAGGVQELWRQAAPGGKGIGSYLRGQVSGSRYFTGVTKVGENISTETDLAYLPGKHLKRMISEMEQTGQYTAREAATRWSELKAGGFIHGWVLRHPGIGQFSSQPMRFKMANSTEAVIGMPEMFANVKVGGVDKAIPFSPLRGMAGDLDADIFSAFLVSPKTEEETANLLRNQSNQFTSEYAQHQLRLGFLKAKKGAGTDTLLSIEEKMIADTRKLGTSQRWVGSLSVNMSAAKQRFSEHIRNAGTLNDAMFAAEYMEQNIISAKHLSPEGVASGEYATLMQRASSALQYGDAGEIASVMRSMVENKGVASELMSGNVPIENATELSRQLGTPINEIRGLDIDKTAAAMADAIQRGQDTTSARMAQLLSGRGRGLTMEEAPNLMKSLLRKSSGGAFAKIATAATTASNILGAAGESIIKHSKPLGWGLAGSLAIATVLSTPSETIGPGANLSTPDINKSPGKAIQRMNAEDLVVDSPSIGNPTVPPMMHQNRAMIIPSAGSSRVRISAIARGGFNSRSFSQGLSTIGARSVNLNVRDNRNSSNQHLRMNKLFR